MPRPILAPLVVALSALLRRPHGLTPTLLSPLFVVEQQRSALVSRLTRQWSDAFALLPTERRLTHEQLSSTLFALRADRLFAVTLAGDAEAVEAVLADAKREMAKPRAATKALGDATVDLTYTPINPCRILDTRATVAGPLAPNLARTFDGYSTNFATQGGTASGCGIPNGVAALAMNVYAVNPTSIGFIKVWPANGVEPDVSTVNYQAGVVAIATGTLVPVDSANSNRFDAKSVATIDFIADVVGYFKPPGDAASLDIKVGGQRVMRYEYNAAAPNVIGGRSDNQATPAGGGTVAGGGDNLAAHFASVGGGSGNEASGTRATISGGTGNRASGYYDGFGTIGHVDSSHGTIGGGSANVVEANYATIGGGAENAMVFQRGLSHNTANADYGVIGGGRGNRAARPYATVAGGYQNAAGSLGIDGQGATVGGGMGNSASGTASVVPGGRANAASGDYSFAGGYRAKVTFGGGTPLGHHGTFVWADANDFDFSSVSANEFAVRSTGGVRFVTSIDGGGGAVNSVRFDPSGNVIATGTFNPPSDVNVKTAFSDVDGLDTLQRVLSVPVRTWAYKSTPAVRHIGPTAQDFRSAFDVGLDDRHIATVDADGVALAAIQGLNAKFDAVIAERDARIVKQDQEIAALRRAIEALLARTTTEERVDDVR